MLASLSDSHCSRHAQQIHGPGTIIDRGLNRNCSAFGFSDLDHKPELAALHPDMAAQVKDQDLIQAARELGEHIPWCEEYEKMISGML
jgi:hypothetical protein